MTVRKPMTCCWLKARDVRGAGLLAVVGLALLGLVEGRIRSAAPLIDRSRETQATGAAQIDINTATKSELISLVGVGPALAERIISDRETRGLFRAIDDLDRVKGIGPKFLEINRHWLTTEDRGSRDAMPTCP